MGRTVPARKRERESEQGKEDTRSEGPKMRRRERRGGLTRTRQSERESGTRHPPCSATRKFDFQIGVARANGSAESERAREGARERPPSFTKGRCMPRRCPCIRGRECVTTNAGLRDGGERVIQRDRDGSTAPGSLELLMRSPPPFLLLSPSRFYPFSSLFLLPCLSFKPLVLLSLSLSLPLPLSTVFVSYPVTLPPSDPPRRRFRRFAVFNPYFVPSPAAARLYSCARETAAVT